MGRVAFPALKGRATLRASLRDAGGIGWLEAPIAIPSLMGPDKLTRIQDGCAEPSPSLLRYVGLHPGQFVRSHKGAATSGLRSGSRETSDSRARETTAKQSFADGVPKQNLGTRSKGCGYVWPA